LRAAPRKAGQREVGGILMAEQLRPGHFRIVDFSLDALSGSHTRFHRDPKTHQKVLDAFFQRTGCDYQRFNYLGEWHSHPSFNPHGKPGRRDALRKFTVLNTVLIFVLERRAPHKPLKLLARPKRFELLTPRFVVRGQRQEAAHPVSSACRALGADGVYPICTLQRAEVCDAVTRPFARELGRPRWGAPERSGPCRDDVEPVSG
jgi:hypothetical protein